MASPLLASSRVSSYLGSTTSLSTHQSRPANIFHTDQMCVCVCLAKCVYIHCLIVYVYLDSRYVWVWMSVFKEYLQFIQGLFHPNNLNQIQKDTELNLYLLSLSPIVLLKVSVDSVLTSF